MKPQNSRIVRRIKELIRNGESRWHRLKIRSHWGIAMALRILDAVGFIASVVFIICLIIYIGYDHNIAEQFRIIHIFHILQWVFAIRIFGNLILDFHNTIHETRPLKWVVNVCLILSLWPLVMPVFSQQWMNIFQTIIGSRAMMIGSLTAFSLMEFSYGVMRMLGRRTNPPLLLASSFLIFIIVGAFMLTMPRCTLTPLSYVDALFVSTSAVCITGLTPVDISTTFTPFGQGILALLIQAGGLGVLTFTSFFALFFSGRQSVYSQLLVKDMIYSKSMNALLPTLLYILLFTLAVEAIGAVAIWLTIHDIFVEMDITTQIKTSLFLSLSSFCNAGFSTIPDGMANARLMNSNQSIYIVVSTIVFAGSIGFPVLVNVRDACHEYIRRSWDKLRHRPTVGRQVRLYNVNTKISVYSTISIFIISTLIFWMMEHNNTLAGFSAFDQWIQSVFNATIPRSSGFQSVAPSCFMPSTLVMIMILMWIGGASQSTAGGVKVNTVATLWLNMKSIVLGRHRVIAYNRTISDDSTRRAISVVCLSMIFFLIYSLTLLTLETTLPPKTIIFEVVSALFTVGSSMGVTASLSATSKIILCTAMFLGRVGIMSLLIGINGNRSDTPVRYPSENIIIN